MENKSDETKSYEKSFDISRRMPCPFYGFEILYEINAENHKSRQVMKDGKGDSCALSEIINMPDKLYCPMESIKNKPNWSECRFNTKENREKIGRNLDKIMVFPKEFEPANKEPWSGLPLRIWMMHVIDTYL